MHNLDRYRAYEAYHAAVSLQRYIRDQDAKQGKLFNRLNCVGGNLSDLRFNLDRIITLLEQELNAE